VGLAVEHPQVEGEHQEHEHDEGGPDPEHAATTP
jgi:hypothetical protein